MLHVLKQDPSIEIGGLLTTMNEQFDRVAMHAVRRRLLEAQAEAAGLPLWTVPLPWPCTNEAVRIADEAAVAQAVAEGFTHVAFGDLFLEDVRRYREAKLAGQRARRRSSPSGAFRPIELAAHMVESGLRAVLTCINPAHLDRSFAGRQFDRALLDRSSGWRRQVRRARRVSFVRLGWADVRPPDADRAGEVVDRDGFSLPTYPERIVCLTEETTETLYLLGEGHRVVGISGYTLRPPEARSKPKVSSFISARFEKIEALEPDLILTFSDLQAGIASELVKRGLPVFAFNQRPLQRSFR